MSKKIKIISLFSVLCSLFFVFCYLLSVFCYLLSPSAFASDYVLPYPSYMPGHKLYRIHQIWEKIEEFWYFGNLAKFKYHLKMSDKYLVEAKTLFEYKQYLLARRALKKSNQHFQKTSLFLKKAQEEGKEIRKKREMLTAASSRHQTVLKDLLVIIPKEFTWQEEKGEKYQLELDKLLKEAILIREKVNF